MIFIFHFSGFWNRNHHTPKPWDGESRSRNQQSYEDYPMMQPSPQLQEEGLPTGKIDIKNRKKERKKERKKRERERNSQTDRQTERKKERERKKIENPHT